jgi:hypothetical protein
MNTLTEALDDFTWDNYKDISDGVVKFDDNNIDGEMMRQASMYSYYHGLMSLAKKGINDQQTDLARFAGELRKSIKDESRTKMTAKDLDDAVMSSPEYFQRMNSMNEMNFKFELLKGLVRALEQKKDMLQQVSANRREETKLYK